MVLLWIAIILFAIWIAWGAISGITAAFWILLAFAVAFLIVHLLIRSHSSVT